MLAVMLIAVMMLTLAACNQNEQKGTTAPPTQAPTAATTGGETVKKPTSINQYKSEGNYPTIKGDMLSWELLNSVPIKTANMDITEARKLCVDFFRVSKSALWIPNADWKAVNQNGTVLRTMDGGEIYAGLPYCSVSNGNIYRLMDYLDPETGVVNVTEAGKNYKLFANQCSFASYWGWGRVINSANFTWTSDIVQYNGYMILGPYTYNTSIQGLYPDDLTPEIIQKNGKETMLKSYAELKAGDGIVYYTTGGHVVMIAQDAHVEYETDGTIDPDKSYVYIIDQAGTWKEATNAQGDKYTFAANTDKKWTFDYLYSHDYIPFTFKEWMGTDPIEETVISYSHTGDTISADQIWGTSITCNYGLSDLYVVVKDAEGNEVYKLVARADDFIQKSITIKKGSSNNVIWGSLETLDQNAEYTVEVFAQIATGERPTLWTGKLAR